MGIILSMRIRTESLRVAISLWKASLPVSGKGSGGKYGMNGKCAKSTGRGLLIEMQKESELFEQKYSRGTIPRHARTKALQTRLAL